MSKRPLMWMVFFLLGGVLWQLTDVGWLPCVFIVLSLLWYCCVGREYTRRLRIFILGIWWLGYALGVFRCSTYVGQDDDLKQELQRNPHVQMQGRICSKERKNDQYIYSIDRVILKTDSDGKEPSSLIHLLQTKKILLKLNTDKYEIHSILVAEGDAAFFSCATNEGMFDALAYYRARGYTFQLVDADVKIAYPDRFSYAEKLFYIKNQFLSSIQENAWEEDVGVLSMILLGDKTSISAYEKELYRNGNMSHILVISGLHISLIGMLLFRILQKAGCHSSIAAVISVMGLYFYAAMIGCSGSVFRAYIMFFLVMLGRILGRTYDRPTALFCAAAILVLQCPYYILDAGFHFSFLAIIGIILAGEKAGKTTVLFMIQLFLLPVTMYYYYKVFPMGILCNLFLVPLVLPLIIFGMLGGIVGLFLPAIGHAFFFVSHMILVFYRWVLECVQSWEGAVLLTGCPSVERMCLYYLLIFVGILLVKKGWKGLEGKQIRRPLKMRSNILLLGTYVIICIMSQIKGKEDTVIDFLDVGQGDAGCIRTSEGETIFIDGGSSNVSSVGKYRIQPYLDYHGVSKVNAWLISHTDNDHVNGLLECMEEGIQIDRIYMSQFGEEDSNRKRIKVLAKEKGISLVYISEGDRLRLKNGSMECVLAKDADGNNGCSLVLEYREGQNRVWFPGDIGEEQEEILLQEKNIHNVTIYKVAHHGSKYSSSQEYLDKLMPQIAIISCGAKNRYGHPHEETMERLEAVGTSIYRTDQCGAVIIEIKKDDVRVRSYVCP